MDKRIIAAGLALAAATAGCTAAGASQSDGPTCEDVPYSNVTSDYPGWVEDFDADNNGLGCEDNDAPDWRDSKPTSSAPVANAAEPQTAEPQFTG